MENSNSLQDHHESRSVVLKELRINIIRETNLPCYKTGRNTAEDGMNDTFHSSKNNYIIISCTLGIYFKCSVVRNSLIYKIHYQVLDNCYSSPSDEFHQIILSY